MSMQDRLKKLEKKANVGNEPTIFIVTNLDGTADFSITWPDGKREEKLLSKEEWKNYQAEHKDIITIQ